MQAAGEAPNGRLRSHTTCLETTTSNRYMADSGRRILETFTVKVLLRHSWRMPGKIRSPAGRVNEFPPRFSARFNRFFDGNPDHAGCSSQPAICADAQERSARLAR